MYFRNSNSTTASDDDNLEAFSSEAGVYPRSDAPDRNDEALDAFPVERRPALARSAPVAPTPAAPTPSAPTRRAPAPPAQPHSKVAVAPQPSAQPRATPGRRRHVGFHWAAATAVLAVCFSVGAGLTHVWLLSLTPETAAPKQERSSESPNSSPPLSGGESGRIAAVPSPPVTRELRAGEPAKPPRVPERSPARDVVKPEVPNRSPARGALKLEVPNRSPAPVAKPSSTPAAADPPARTPARRDTTVPSLGVADPRADALASLPSVAAATPPSFIRERAPERAPSNERTVAPRAAVPPPPPPAGAGARPAPSAAPAEEEIRRAINRYQSAYERLDAGAAKEVWPTVDAAALARAFQNLESQDLSLSDCRFDVTGARAQATCKGTARYVRRVGNKAAQQDQRQWHFRLSRDANTWKIDSVQTR